MENEALLVTQDAGMAKYVSGLWEEKRKSGMAVVFYECASGQADTPADLIALGFEEIGVQFLDRVQKRKNGLPWNILYTKRTCVREITMEDLDELYVIYEGEGITDFTEPLFERKKEEEYTRNYIQYMYYYYGYGMWVVQDRQSGKLLGRAGIERRQTQTGTVMELGYLIRAEEQGKDMRPKCARQSLLMRSRNWRSRSCTALSIRGTRYPSIWPKSLDLYGADRRMRSRTDGWILKNVFIFPQIRSYDNAGQRYQMMEEDSLWIKWNGRKTVPCRF